MKCIKNIRGTSNNILKCIYTKYKISETDSCIVLKGYKYISVQVVLPLPSGSVHFLASPEENLHLWLRLVQHNTFLFLLRVFYYLLNEVMLQGKHATVIHEKTNKQYSCTI